MAIIPAQPGWYVALDAGAHERLPVVAWGVDSEVDVYVLAHTADGEPTVMPLEGTDYGVFHDEQRPFTEANLPV
jgi:hypothetical protein